MNALVPINTPPMTISDVERVALAIAKGGLFGSSDANAVLTLCLLAQAEGQHPAVVFRDYHIIQGKPAKKAEAMLRDFINSGGRVEWHKLDDTAADATFSHPAGSARIDWTLDRAKKAGLTTPMWSKYPRQMLRSRVISEGIRTVYPGATSGLYESGEVADITGAPIDLTPHNPETGEVVELQAEKVPGIHKIKQRLGEMMKAGDAATDADAFSALVKANKDDLKTIRDAKHQWWTGDGEDFEGYEAWIARRRAELTPPETSAAYQFLASLMEEAQTGSQLQNLASKHGEAIDKLDDAERRMFERRFDEREAGLKVADQVTAAA